jgi:hypothetical protein
LILLSIFKSVCFSQEEEEDDYSRRKRTTTAISDSNGSKKVNRKVPASPPKKSQRCNKNITSYCEASSDDEFAKKHFMLDSSDDEVEISRHNKGSSAKPHYQSR